MSRVAVFVVTETDRDPLNNGFSTPSTVHVHQSSHHAEFLNGNGNCTHLNVAAVVQHRCPLPPGTAATNEAGAAGFAVAQASSLQNINQFSQCRASVGKASDAPKRTHSD